MYRQQPQQENAGLVKIGKIPWIPGGGRTAEEEEREWVAREKLREKSSVIHQPHRTLPVVLPKPKVRHDYPIGSYLRHVTDPYFHSNTYHPVDNRRPLSPPGVMVDPEKKRLLEQMSPKVLHLQYNSPLAVYSTPLLQQQLQQSEGGVSNAPNDDHLRYSPTLQLIRQREEEERQPHQSQSFYNLHRNIHLK